MWLPPIVNNSCAHCFCFSLCTTLLALCVFVSHRLTCVLSGLIKPGRSRNARGSIARHVRNARALRQLRQALRLRTQAALGITTIITMCTPNLPFSVRQPHTNVKVFVLRKKIKPGRKNAHGLIVRRVANAMVSRNICPFLFLFLARTSRVALTC